jgi:hypothetical protein
MAEMTPDFSPFSYVFNNPVNFIDEFGLMCSGWNTRGREETDAEKANKEQMQKSDNKAYIQTEVQKLMGEGSGKVPGAPDDKSNPILRQIQNGDKVMEPLPKANGFWENVDQYLAGDRIFTSLSGAKYNVNAQGELYDIGMRYGVIPDIGLKHGTIYKGIKEGLPYIGKTFNLVKRYTNSEKFALSISGKMSGTFRNNKVLRAVEQTVLEFKKKIGPVANKNNAFNPKSKDYNQYMKEAKKWLNTNFKDWQTLFD